MFHDHLDSFQEPSFGGRHNTKPGDHGTPSTYNRWFIPFHHVWGPARIGIYQNNVWVMARSHTGFTLHDLGGVSGRPWDTTFFWAPTISWSRLLAHVWGSVNHTTWVWRCVETALGHYFRLGSHKFMVIALGSCVRLRDDSTWPWRYVGTALGHFPWAPTISWSRLLAHVWGSVNHSTWVWSCVETTLGHFLLGSHKFMVTALGSCVRVYEPQYMSLEVF